MSDNPIKIILVDTNCFIRLYHSSALPIFGTTIGGYTFLSLECLINEYLESKSLIEKYPWIAQEPKLSDLYNAKLKLSKASKTGVQNQIKDLKPYAKSFLEHYCKKRNISIRALSPRDVELLATAVALKCSIATDEWPLRQVALDLMNDPDEYHIELLSSIELLCILEMDGKITSEQRRDTVKAWILNKENLLRGWQDDYQRVFGESADELDI